MYKISPSFTSSPLPSTRRDRLPAVGVVGRDLRASFPGHLDRGFPPGVGTPDHAHGQDVIDERLKRAILTSIAVLDLVPAHLRLDHEAVPALRGALVEFALD